MMRQRVRSTRCAHAGRARGLRAAALVGALSLLAACGTQSNDAVNVDDSPVPLEDVPALIAPVVDRASGSLAPGSARPLGAEYTSAVISQFIVRTETNRCLRENGYTGPVSDPRMPDPIYQVVVAHPPWLEDQAAQFGFMQPQPLPDLVHSGVVLEVVSAEQIDEVQATWDERAAVNDAAEAAKESAAYIQAEQACEDDAVLAEWEAIDLWEKSGGPWLEEFQADGAESYRDPAMKPIKADFVACVEESGLEVVDPESTDRSELFHVVGMDYSVIDEQQVTLATQVARCMEQTGAAERVMDVRSQYEARTFLEYENELVEERQHIEGIQAKVDEYVATHG